MKHTGLHDEDGQDDGDVACSSDGKKEEGENCAGEEASEEIAGTSLLLSARGLVGFGGGGRCGYIMLGGIDF